MVWDQIDTTIPHGTQVFRLSAALSEFKREIIIECTNAGLVAARARGRLESHNTLKGKINIIYLV
ncbi:recombinase family protein [Candidatus Odyssella thessalonicensis]|uniref:recombinase family protein n=1 Tax=Candidatus Odyssella thessalonicensis TaxID=84647 RepID=UPI000496B99C